jgi:hypothetical protein
MDQIVRKLQNPDNLYSDKGSMEIIGTMRRLAHDHRIKPRATWKDIPADKRWSPEAALHTAGELEITDQKRIFRG